MNVNEIMSTPVKCCSSDTTLETIARMMWVQDCGSIPVVGANHEPLGIVTDRDIAMAAMLNQQPLWNLTAATVIQGQQLARCNPHESIESCVNKMEQSKVRRILVTDEGGALCGIVSMGDAVAFTRPERARDWSSEKEIGSDQVLGMLRKVSSHHQPDDRASMH